MWTSIIQQMLEQALVHCGSLGRRVCFNKADLFHMPQEKRAGSSSVVSILRQAVMYPVNKAASYSC